MHTAVRTLLMGSLLAGCWAAPAPAEQATEQTVEQAPTPAEIVVKPPVEPVAEPTPPPPGPAPCKVEQLYAGSRPHSLAVDATHVYFMEGSMLSRLPRTGGAVEQLISSVESVPPVLVDDQLIVCRDNDRYDVTLLRVAKDNSRRDSIGTADECKLARIGQHLYFPINVDGYKPWLARKPVTGGAVEQLLALDRSLTEIVADASHVYYTTLDDNLYRFDPATRTSTQLATERAGMMELGITATQLAWLEHGNLMRMPKSGPPAQPQVVANFQDVLSFASSGDDLYWASITERSWRRHVVGDANLRTFAVPTGSTDIVVDGKRVFWNALDKQGGIYTLDTSACGDDVLVPSPAIRGIVGPEQEDTLRYGYADAGEVTVEVRDLSSDEHQALLQVAAAHGYERPPINAANLPPRFVVGDAYRVATSDGIFDASLTGFELSYGGEGLHFFLVLRIGEAGASVSGTALASKRDIAKFGVLRDGDQPADVAATYLAVVRAAFDEAGLDGKRVEADALQVVRGKFPAPHVALIAVELAPPEDEDDEHNLNYLSALLLGDTEGKISGEVYWPDERLDRFSIGYLVDVDGDGVDEVLFSSSYYEGSYEHLLEWNDDRPTTTTLAGDGA